MTKNAAAVKLGRKGGAVTSERKAAAARANGAKGGRPVRYATCRLCAHGIEHETDSVTGYRVLFKYGVRHYAHAECALQKWGAEFLTMLPTHEVGNLPVLVLDSYGLVEAARERLKESA